jgi:hypothetical protein
MKKILPIIFFILLSVGHLSALPCTVSASASGTSTGCGADSGTATASATGGTLPYTYTWNNGAVGSNISNLAAGIYIVTVTDVAGCTGTAAATVSSPATFSITAFSTPEICEGGITGSAWVVVSGDTNTVFYNWSDGEGTDSITELVSGGYSVTVTDASGCSKSTQVTVSEPANPLTVTATVTPSTCGGSTGAISTTVTGNIGVVSYFWSGIDDTTANVSGLSVGNYTVQVTSGGCTASATVSVNNSNGPAISMLVTEPTCFNGTNGADSATITGGTAPYAYVWTPGGYTSPSITGLAAGTYTLTVSDHNNCLGTEQVIIGQPEDISVVDYVNNVSCNGGTNGSVVLSVTGGTSPFRYSWAGGDTLSYLSNIAQGNFSVTVTDANGCTAPWQVSVLQPQALLIATSSTNSSGNNGTATAQPTGGTTPYHYEWSNGGTSKTESSLAAGNYSVTVTDSRGCSASATVTVGIGVGISPVEEELLSASIFPNPANDVIGIKLQAGINAQIEFRVFDLTGRLLYEEAKGPGPLPTQNISISTFASGIYLLEVDLNGQSLRQRFVISR